MKILIVGGGSIGKRHLKNLQSLGYSDVWVLKRHGDKEFEKEYNVDVITSFKKAELLNFNVVFVCTPTSMHNESLKFAVDNNLHVFMEKPLIHNQEGLTTAISLMKKYDKVFFIGFMLRYHPLVQKIKEVLDSGNLGNVYNARFEFGSFLPYWHPWEDYKISYASRKDLGGGVISTITHELDLIQYYFGKPESVYCEATNLDLLDINVEEMCEAIFTYKDKVVTLHLDYLQKDYDRNIKILCEKGKILWNWHENRINIFEHKASEEYISLNDFNVNDLYIAELKEFIDLVSKNEINHNLDFTHAKKNTELLLCMHRAANTQKQIKF